MLRTTIAAVWVVVAISLASTGIAQTPDDEGEAHYRELEQARTQMDVARRQLEEAARSIASSVYVLPNRENSDWNFEYEGDGLWMFGGQGQIGATIVNSDGGALVTALTAGAGAEQAGLKVGDVIQSIDDIDVTAGGDGPSAAIRSQLRDVEPGAAVSVAVERSGQTLDFEVETGAGPAWATDWSGPGRDGVRVFSTPGAAPSVALNNLESLQLGLDPLRLLGFAGSPWADMELVAVSEGLGRYFDTTEGLLVVRGPENDAIDIQDGDVILSISGRTPNSPAHAIRILSSFESGETIEFSIMRDGRRETVEYSMLETRDRTRPVPLSD